MTWKHAAEQLITNPKTAAATTATTTATGLSDWLNIIPDDIGKLATLIGICLSCVLIRIQLKKGKLEYEVKEMEKRKLTLEIEQQEEINKRLKENSDNE
jgi:hypothetical protein